MIGISVRIEKLYNGLNTVGRQQLPFGLALGLNQTGKDIQATQRRGIAQRFTLRRPSFVLSTVHMRQEDMATKASLIQRVRVGGHTADGKAHGKRMFGAMLARHEAGGSFHDGYFIPTQALRPSFAQLVPLRMWPTALSLWRTERQIAAGTAGQPRRHGKQRSFSIINRQGEFLIFQRFGLTTKQIRRRQRKGGFAAVSAAERMDHGIRLIWARVQSIRLRPRLGFAETARLVTRSRLANNVEAGMLRALSTARPR